MKKGEEYYNDDYFAWQKESGEFGAKVEFFKFSKFINEENTVLDFGCGGGYMLAKLTANRKIGVEINDVARQQASKKGIEVYKFTSDVPDCICDIIISNHVLEHTLNPYEELKMLNSKLKKNGKMIFVVPNEKKKKWNPNDINKHLYTWAEINIGNLFDAAGYNVLSVKELHYRWPPYFLKFYKIFGYNIFQVICKLNAFLRTNLSQIIIVVEKK